MRVLHLLASPYWSGPVDTIATLAEAQRALGHEVFVAVDRKRARAAAEELAAPRLKRLRLLDRGGLELSVKSLPLAVLRDVRELHGRELDVLHTHFTHDHVLARFGCPPGARLIRSLHAPRSIRWSLPRADGYTVPSAAFIERMGERKAMILPALVGEWFRPAPSPLQLRAELGLEGDPLVGMVSTFQPSRRHEVGIAAFARLLEHRPHARLVLLGDGALEPELRGQVRRERLEQQVTFAGYQSGLQFVHHLQALDEVWVLGSGNDWSGRAAAQARACGARVLAVDEGGLGAWADAVLPEPTAAAVVAASLEPSGRDVAIPAVADIAAQVMAFYAACGAQEQR
jgi:L-malate glycosyltransferase